MEQTQPLPAGQRLEADFSSLDELNWCPRLYYNHIELGLVPIEAPPSMALAFGDAIHQAIEVLTLEGDLLAALDKFDEVYTKPYEAEGWDDALRTPYIGRTLLHSYYQKWGLPKNLYTEEGAAVEVDDVLYYGKIDRILDDEDATVADIKTTSALFWLPQARLNWQLVGYAHMARELTGVNPKRVAIDAIVIPRISQALIKKYKGELPPEGEMALNFHDCLHFRDAIITARDYDEWHRWLQWCVFQIKLCRETNAWPMKTPRPCTRFGRECEYAVLCKAQDADQEQRLVENLFKVERWRPYEFPE